MSNSIKWYVLLISNRKYKISWNSILFIDF